MSSQFPLSLDWLIANRPDLLPSVELDGYPGVDRHEEPGWAQELEALPAAIKRLSPDRQELIVALFFKGMSLRAYARQTGRAYTSVHEQRERTLKTLRKYIEDERAENTQDSQD